MKRTFILIFILLNFLVACQKDPVPQEMKLESLLYSEEVSVSIRWGDGTKFEVEDKEIIKNLLETINEEILMEEQKPDLEGFLYYIDIESDKKLRITNGCEMKIGLKRYVFKKNQIKTDIELILIDYIPIMVDGRLKHKNDNMANGLSPEAKSGKDEDNSSVKESAREQNRKSFDIVKLDAIDISFYNYIGRLLDGTEVYFKPSGFWHKQELVSEIIIRRGDDYYSLINGQASRPEISPDKNKLMFIDGVGFEFRGNIFVYDSLSNNIQQKTFDNYGYDPDENTTIKHSVWYDDETAVAIIGFDTGTITQGGNVYMIDLDTGDRWEVIRTNSNVEIVNLSLEEDILLLEIIKWVKNYTQYEYYEQQVDIGDYSTADRGEIDIVIETWEPWNLERKRMTAEEILSLELVTPEATEEDMEGLEVKQYGAFPKYADGEIIYTFTEYDPKLWRIEICGPTDFETPRNIQVGDTFEEVLALFPHEKNWKTSDHGELYGEVQYDYELQEQVAHISKSNRRLRLTVLDKKLPGIAVYFEEDVVVLIEIYLYHAN